MGVGGCAQGWMCSATFKFKFKTQKCYTKTGEIWPLEGVNFSRFPDENFPGNGKTKKSDSRVFPGREFPGINRYA